MNTDNRAASSGKFQPGVLTDALKTALKRQVHVALEEDVGCADLSAAAAPDKIVTASVVTHDTGVLAGKFWFDEVFAQLDSKTETVWLGADGEVIRQGQELCRVKGSAPSLLTGERCALNFLQTLSATATATAAFVKRADGKVRIMDTRKTIPGLRLAQKYAVACGGGDNHRLGLFDGILLKENHVRVYGSIKKAVSAMRRLYPDSAVEVETESLSEVREALEAGAEVIMLDNFPAEEIRRAVAVIARRAQVEISGNVNLTDVHALLNAGVDRISIGAITKHVHAMDMSMRFI